MQSLKMYMISKHGTAPVNQLFGDIQDVILNSLLSVQKIIIQDKHCFEVYGYDIIIDDRLKPWLLEVNASPSLTADTKEDYELKSNMLNDALNILDMEKKLSGQEDQVGGWDVIYRNGGPVRIDKRSTVPTYLGCFNNREKNLKKIFKNAAASQG
jgi:tubulin polyglutamylase TTLL9